MATFRTLPPPAYLSPTRDEMKEAAKRIGLKAYASDLVEDLAHMAAGGSVLPPSAYRQVVEEGVKTKLPTKPKDWDQTIAKAMKYHQAVVDFVLSINGHMTEVPGATPLEKAMGLLKLLAQKKGGEASGSGDDITLPLFSEDDPSPEAVASELNEIIETVNHLSDDEVQMLDPDGGEPKPVEGGDGAGEKGLDPKRALKIAEDMLKGKQVMLDISRHLDTLSRMQVRRQRKLEPDPEGDERRFRPLTDLSEMGQLTASEWALRQVAPGLFMYRLATSQAQIRERVTRLEKKQILFILMDISGSMGQKPRLWKAGGIVMNRLKAVINADAELWFVMFDTKLKEEHYAGTPEEARALIKKLTEGNFSGGGTAIATCVKAAVARIQKLLEEGLRYKPEIVVVSDGEDDTSSLRLEDLSGVKLHAFMVECSNEHLTNLAIRSGGVGVNKF